MKKGSGPTQRSLRDRGIAVIRRRRTPKRDVTGVMYLLGVSILVLTSSPTSADGRLIATGGATQIEGSAGGGITPWAVLGGYGTAGQNGATGFVSAVNTGDYRLDAIGASWIWNNRIELSAARQDLDLGALSTKLGLPQDERLGLDVLGAKVRVVGDIIYGELPQVSIGMQHKRQRDFEVPETVGAEDDTGTDVYVSVGRLFLAGVAGRNVYVNATARSTRANELGLLGFGGPGGNDREWMIEGAVAMFLDRRTAVGVEHRQKPENLAFAEDDWNSVFVAWFPSKKMSLTAAWVDLGSIATLDNQRGLYLSAEVTF
ncbi:MAG: DUF3034 family protein [Halofilum sp. (in: g-proteobacteria)]